MLSHPSLDFGVSASPIHEDQQMISIYDKKDFTMREVSHKAMRRPVNEVTLPCNADRRQDVVSRTHDLPDTRRRQFVDYARRARFQLVLKDNEAYKLKIAFDVRTGQFLHLDPAEFRYVLCGACNNTVTSIGVKS